MKKPLTHEQFISDVVRFCNRHLIAPSELGATIFNDRAFFGRLREGISPRLEKIEKVYDYMIAHEEAEVEQKFRPDSSGQKQRLAKTKKRRGGASAD